MLWVEAKRRYLSFDDESKAAAVGQNRDSAQLPKDAIL
jgi:hypothetical protein